MRLCPGFSTLTLYGARSLVGDCFFWDYVLCTTEQPVLVMVVNTYLPTSDALEWVDFQMVGGRSCVGEKCISSTPLLLVESVLIII